MKILKKVLAIYAIANNTLQCRTCAGKYTLHYQKNS